MVYRRKNHGELGVGKLVVRNTSLLGKVFEDFLGGVASLPHFARNQFG